MHLFFIRHGETVDNVASLYAGSRDSPLTAHGVLQARRLASSLAQRCAVARLFYSPLQRAVKTAEAILDAQRQAHGGAAGLDVLRVPELREKDFGDLEGVGFGHHVGSAGARPTAANAETSQSLGERASRFLDEHVFPALRDGDDGSGVEPVYAIVAHGIFLQVLVKTLLGKFPRAQVVLPPPAERLGLLVHSTASVVPPWSNTGFLEAFICTRPPASAGSSALPASPVSGLGTWPWLLRIERVNSTSHLENLAKTRGGIGSAPFDDRQRTITRFFSPLSNESAGRREGD